MRNNLLGFLNKDMYINNMKMFFSYIKKLIRKFSYRRASRLPIGMTEFHAWSDSIIETYSLPENESSKWALASQILNLKQTEFYVPKRYFGLTTLKSMSNQIAYGYMEMLKQKQKEQQKAEEDAQKQAAKTESPGEV